MTEEKNPPTLEHQEPPIYYCWKYWMSNGEIREGCTPIRPNGQDTWPDLNDYGWVYVAVPVAIIFVIVFLTYLTCSKTGSKIHSPGRKSTLVGESDSEDELHSPRSKWLPVRSYQPAEVPNSASYGTNEVSKFATVVHMSQLGNLSAANRKASPKENAPSLRPQGIDYQQSGQRSNELPHDEKTLINGRRAASNQLKKKPDTPSLPNVAHAEMKAGTVVTKNAEESSSDDDRASDALLLNHQHTDKQPWF